ncbi:MAG: hypothetical protein AAF621_04260 [Pseudomonadota bacterium]
MYIRGDILSFCLSFALHLALLIWVATDLFSIPKLPEPPQGEITIDFDLTGGFETVTQKSAKERLAEKPEKENIGKALSQNIGMKEKIDKIAQAEKLAEEKRKEAEVKRQKELAEKRKLEEEQRQKEIAEKKKQEDIRKKELAEKKKREEEAKRKKELAEKKKREKEEKRKKELAAKKKREALIAKKKKAQEGVKKRLLEERIANKLKALEDKQATDRKKAGQADNEVAKIISKKSSGEATGSVGKKSKQTAAPSQKLGGGLSWSDKNKIIESLRPCWEQYQGGAKKPVKVGFALDKTGRLQGNVTYISGDRGYALAAAKRAVAGCHVTQLSTEKLTQLSADGLEVQFTPLGISF